MNEENSSFKNVRGRYAAMAMQALIQEKHLHGLFEVKHCFSYQMAYDAYPNRLTSYEGRTTEINTYEEIAEKSIKYADALMKKLGEI